jgi:hypothetical protein
MGEMEHQRIKIISDLVVSRVTVQQFTMTVDNLIIKYITDTKNINHKIKLKISTPSCKC